MRRLSLPALALLALGSLFCAAQEFIVINPQRSAARYALLASVQVGRNPIFCAASPSGRKLFVSNHDGDSISIIDTVTMRESKRLRVGRGPLGIAFASERLAVVCNWRGREISLIDVPAGREVRRIRVGDGPVYVATSADGRYAYVSCQRADAVSVVDLMQRRKVRDIAVARGPTGVAVAADPPVLYVSCGPLGRLLAIDALRHEPAGQAELSLAGISPLAVNGQHLFALGAADTLLKIDAQTGQLVRRIPVGRSPFGIAIGGNHMYVSNPGAASISVVELESFSEVGTIAAGGVPRGLAVSPDLSALYVCDSAADQLRVISLGSSQ